MRMKATGWLVLAGALALPAEAPTHVTVHPNRLPAGSFQELDVRVPNEEKNTNTSRLAVRFPPGFVEVSTGYLPGWNVKVLTSKLAKPVQTDERAITEQVREVIWSGGKIPPETFLNFPVSTMIPETAGKVLTFKAVQTYDNGKVVRWIGTPSSDQPAPTVNVTGKHGVVQDVAGTGAATSQPASTSTKSSSKGASKGLGIAALVVAILALIAGLIALALVIGRRARTGTG